MPDNFDDNQIENMSIDEINELFENAIEMPYVENIAAKDYNRCGDVGVH